MLQLSEFQPEVLYAFPFRNERPGTYVYHQHAFLELSIMLEGFSDYNVEGNWRRVTAGQALLFNPGIHHQETQSPYTQSMQLHIGFRHIELPVQPLNQLPFTDSLVNLDSYQQEFMSGARRLVTESQRTTTFGHTLLIQAMVVEQLCLLLRALPENQISSDLVIQQAGNTKADQTALVNAATYYLEAHYNENLTLGTVADILHVSSAYLSRTFKLIRGERPINYLTRLRMTRAKTLLIQDARPVSEVARAVGYQDPYYFSRLFKRYFGTAPSLVNKL